MDLILWRHAEAEDGFPDERRKLTDKGRRQAAKMARWLVDRLPKQYTLLVSPADRTRETAEALARKFTASDAVGLGASPDTVLVAAGWPNAAVPVVVVGHQPTLGRTVGRLITGGDVDWGVRKGSIVWLTHKGGGTVIRAILPPELL